MKKNNLYAGAIYEGDFCTEYRTNNLTEVARKYRSVERFNKRCETNCKNRDKVK